VPAYWRNLFPSSAQGPELSPKPNVREETGGRGNPFADGLGSLVEGDPAMAQVSEPPCSAVDWDIVSAPWRWPDGCWPNGSDEVLAPIVGA